MDEDLDIPREKLQQVLEVLLDHVYAQQGTSVTVQEDFFWDVAPDDVYNPYEEPAELTLGQLTESWDNLEKILSGDKPVLGYGLVWLGDVLRVIGHKNAN